MQTLWFTGLPFSGKATLAKRLKERLLFGHVIDECLMESQGLDFSYEDEHFLKDIAFTCRQLNDNGIFVINSIFVSSPFVQEEVREIMGERLITVNLDCPKVILAKRMFERMNREKSRLYLKHAGGWKIFCDSNFKIDTSLNSIGECVQSIRVFLSRSLNF